MSKSFQIALTLFVTLLALPVMNSTAQAALVYSFIASQDVPGNNVWTDNLSTIPARNWTFAGGARSPVAVTPATGTTFTSAYNFGGKADSTGFQSTDLSGTANASFEIWFKPNDLIGREVLFETGGINNGASLVLDGNILKFATTQADIPIRPQLNITSLGSDNFIHAVGVVDVTNNVTRLYVNGNLASSLAGVRNWSLGSAGAGLGGINNSLGGWFGDDTGWGDFNGQIALMNLYNAPLSASQVLAAFQAFQFTPAPEPSSFLLLGLGMLGLSRHSRRRRGSRA